MVAVDELVEKRLAGLSDASKLAETQVRLMAVQHRRDVDMANWDACCMSLSVPALLCNAPHAASLSVALELSCESMSPCTLGSCLIRLSLSRTAHLQAASMIERMIEAVGVEVARREREIEDARHEAASRMMMMEVCGQGGWGYVADICNHFVNAAGGAPACRTRREPTFLIPPLLYNVSFPTVPPSPPPPSSNKNNTAQRQLDDLAFRKQMQMARDTGEARAAFNLRMGEYRKAVQVRAGRYKAREVATRQGRRARVWRGTGHLCAWDPCNAAVSEGSCCPCCTLQTQAQRKALQQHLDDVARAVDIQSKRVTTRAKNAGGWRGALSKRQQALAWEARNTAGKIKEAIAARAEQLMRSGRIPHLLLSLSQLGSDVRTGV